MSKKRVITITVTLYRSTEELPLFLTELSAFAKSMASEFVVECIFVSDGDSEDSLNLLYETLPKMRFLEAQVIELSRNFGATYAMRCALEHGTGDIFAPVPPDLQEPFSLVAEGIKILDAADADLCFGQRMQRKEGISCRYTAQIFWLFYHHFIQREIPVHGIDFFVCNRRVRDALVSLPDKSLFFPALLSWVGFKRVYLSYERVAVPGKKSSWSMKKKINYALDSVFSFSLFPTRLFGMFGFLSFAVFLLLVLQNSASKTLGYLPAIVLAFFGALNCLGISIVGEYLGRILEGINQKPLYLIRSRRAIAYEEKETNANS